MCHFPNVCCLSIDWLDDSNFLYNSDLEHVLSLSIWGLDEHALRYDAEDEELTFSLEQQLQEYFNSHPKPNCVHLGLHMIDHSCHERLFTLLRDQLDQINIRTLNIGIEPENAGVMSFYPLRQNLYTAPEPNSRVLPLLHKKSHELRRSVCDSQFGRCDLLTVLKLEECLKQQQILIDNFEARTDLLGCKGILDPLWKYKCEKFNGFAKLFARGFEYEFKELDIMRLEMVPFRVYF